MDQHHFLRIVSHDVLTQCASAQVRKDLGGHDEYVFFRSVVELLEVHDALHVGRTLAAQAPHASGVLQALRTEYQHEQEQSILDPDKLMHLESKITEREILERKLTIVDVRITAAKQARDWSALKHAQAEKATLTSTAYAENWAEVQRRSRPIVLCKGKHRVDGPNGCHDNRCRRRPFCVPDCHGCPDLPTQSPQSASWSPPKTKSFVDIVQSNSLRNTNIVQPASGPSGLSPLRLDVRPPPPPPPSLVQEAHATPAITAITKEHSHASEIPSTNVVQQALSVCKGQHTVTGPNGCSGARCRDHQRCVPECSGCPDLPPVQFRANDKIKHSVSVMLEGCADPRAVQPLQSPIEATAQDVSLHCLGNHAVDGAEGCHDDRCRGMKVCVAACLGCPQLPHPAFQVRDKIKHSVGAVPPEHVNLKRSCKGKHSVDDSEGRAGCHDDRCRGLPFCRSECRGCPDRGKSGHVAVSRYRYR